MNYSILSIGDELLIGKIANTNAQYISKQLNVLGHRCVRHEVVGDYEKDIVESLTRLTSISDLVITTGGLGLTADDITKSTVAKFCGLSLIRNEIQEKITTDYYARKNVEMSDVLHGFDYLPESSLVLKNYTGVACGFVVKYGKCDVAVFPGPPTELKPMFEADFLPYIASKSGAITTRYFKIFGIRELLVEDAIKDLKYLEDEGIYITTYASNNEVTLVLRADDADISLINNTVIKISEKFGRSIYSFENEELEQTAFKLLQIRKKKVSTVESLTGGLIASKLIAIPGMSEYFNEGLVTYSNNSKVFRVDVSPDDLENYGAVSEQVARSMCDGLLQNPLNELVIATTGNAGPTAEKGNADVGDCYIAIGEKGKVDVFKHKFVGDRNYVREAVAKQSLFYLVNYLKYNEI